MTAVVGSYPKPDDIFYSSGRALLDEMGMPFYRLEKILDAEKFQGRLDKAALEAIEDQNTARIDLMTDGSANQHLILFRLKERRAASI